jgi:acetyl-CoA acetyltransferase
MVSRTLAAGIVGIGESKVGRVADLNSLQLQYSAAKAALSDAGMTFADIDGLITLPVRTENWSNPAGYLTEQFGIAANYLSTVNIAGASGTAMVHQAAMAIASGQCHTVLCVAGQNLLSSDAKPPGGGITHPQFEAPYRPPVPSLYALVAQRHMHEFGTTSEQLAEVAVAIRYHASLNPNAHKREPIGIEDVINSRPVASPLHMLDCSIVSDGACAIVVTAADRARDSARAPVRILGAGYGQSHYFLGDYPTLTTTGAVASGKSAFAAAGLTPEDIDVAELYDCFTITVILELEDLGFCQKGEGGQFVSGGRIRLGGDLPVTTHGGLLSGGHPGLPGGLFHVVEGVRQLRHQLGERQVADAQTALVHGNGGIVGVHCTLILGKD